MTSVYDLREAAQRLLIAMEKNWDQATGTYESEGFTLEILHLKNALRVETRVSEEDLDIARVAVHMRYAPLVAAAHALCAKLPAAPDWLSPTRGWTREESALAKAVEALGTFVSAQTQRAAHAEKLPQEPRSGAPERTAAGPVQAIAEGLPQPGASEVGARADARRAVSNDRSPADARVPAGLCRHEAPESFRLVRNRGELFWCSACGAIRRSRGWRRPTDTSASDQRLRDALVDIGVKAAAIGAKEISVASAEALWDKPTDPVDPDVERLDDSTLLWTPGHAAARVREAESQPLSEPPHRQETCKERVWSNGDMESCGNALPCSNHPVNEVRARQTLDTIRRLLDTSYTSGETYVARLRAAADLAGTRSEPGMSSADDTTAKRPRWTVSVYLTSDIGRVLLVRHKKLGLWLPVGGGILTGERPNEAAIREVREETGFEIGRLRYLGYDEHEGSGGILHMNHAFRARVERSPRPFAACIPKSDGSWTEYAWLSQDAPLPEPVPANVREGVRLVFAPQYAPACDESPTRLHAEQPRWRVGKNVGRTLYLKDTFVGHVDTAELANELVNAANGFHCARCHGTGRQWDNGDTCDCCEPGCPFAERL